MADRTNNLTLDPQTNPLWVSGRVNASDGDTFLIPPSNPSPASGVPFRNSSSGLPQRFIFNPTGDDDVIVTATVSGSTVTLGCIDDEGNAVGTGFNIDFICFLRTR